MLLMMVLSMFFVMILVCIIVVANNNAEEPVGVGSDNETDPGNVPLPQEGPNTDIPAGARVGNSLSDFNVDNSLVFPRGAANEIQNITQIGKRTFNFVLRHRGNPWSPLNPGGTKGAWYDGDRDLSFNEGRHELAPGQYKDKSRAEIVFKNLTINKGDTWEFGTTVRLDPGFVPSKAYCQIMQPLVHHTYLQLVDLRGNTVIAETGVYENGVNSREFLARKFEIKRGEWTTIKIRTKVDTDGFYWCSVNGDKFQGINANTYRGEWPTNPKWGLYGSATWDVFKRPLKDQILQHSNIYAYKVPK